MKKSLRTQNPKSPQNADKKAVRKAAKQEAMKMRKMDPANQAADTETAKEEKKQPEPKDKKDQKARAQQKTAPDSSTSPKPQVSVSQIYLPTWSSQSLTPMLGQQTVYQTTASCSDHRKGHRKDQCRPRLRERCVFLKRLVKSPTRSLTSAKPWMSRPPKSRNWPMAWTECCSSKLLPHTQETIENKRS